MKAFLVLLFPVALSGFSCASDKSSSENVAVFSEQSQKIQFNLQDFLIESLSNTPSENTLWISSENRDTDQNDYKENFVTCSFDLESQVSAANQGKTLISSSVEEIKNSEIEDAAGMWEVKFIFNTSVNQQIQSISCLTYEGRTLTLDRMNTELSKNLTAELSEG
jgi:hypothetical protein